nr:hypothetical protein [Actinomadura graeca]
MTPTSARIQPGRVSARNTAPESMNSGVIATPMSAATASGRPAATDSSTPSAPNETLSRTAAAAVPAALAVVTRTPSSIATGSRTAMWVRASTAELHVLATGSTQRGTGATSSSRANPYVRSQARLTLLVSAVSVTFMQAMPGNT